MVQGFGYWVYLGFVFFRCRLVLFAGFLAIPPLLGGHLLVLSLSHLVSELFGLSGFFPFLRFGRPKAIDIMAVPLLTRLTRLKVEGLRLRVRIEGLGFKGKGKGERGKGLGFRV